MAVNHQYIAVGTAAGRVRVWGRTGSEGDELQQLLQVRGCGCSTTMGAFTRYSTIQYIGRDKKRSVPN